MKTGPESKRDWKRIAALPLLCLGGAVLNLFTGIFFRDTLGIPLFMEPFLPWQ
jgi:hypothetical protein